MPNKPITEIDHLLTYVHDLDAAASLFARMGFTLSPVSRIDAMGISNRLVLMRPPTPGFANYIELMATHDRSRLPPAMTRILAAGEGIKSMVLGADDAAVAQAAMIEHGFHAAAPIHVRREWTIGPGESVFPEFDVILPVEAPLVFNCCRYFNVGLYLREDWLTHANGARRLRAVFAVADDPGAVGARFAGLFGNPLRGVEGQVRTSPGKVDLEVMHAAGAKARVGLDVAAPNGGARYLGYLIEVSSLDVLKACLDRGRVEYRVRDRAVQVAPADGLGNLIVFSAEGQP